MIKKLNIAFAIVVVCLFGMKLLLDAARSAKENRSRPVNATVASPGVSQFAPHVYFTRWPPHFAINRVANRNGIGLDVIREIFPNAIFDETKDTTDIEVVRKLLDEDPYALVVDQSLNIPELEDYPRSKHPASICALSVFVPRSSDWRYAGPESLDKLRLGMCQAYGGSKLCSQFRTKWGATPGKMVVVKSRDITASVFNSLIDEGKIDGFVAIWSSEELALQNEESATFRRYRRTRALDVCCLYPRASKKDPELGKQIIDEFEKGYERLVKSGVLRRIIAYYGSSINFKSMDDVFGKGFYEDCLSGKGAEAEGSVAVPQGE